MSEQPVESSERPPPDQPSTGDASEPGERPGTPPMDGATDPASRQDRGTLEPANAFAGPSIAEGLAGLPPSPGEVPRTVAEAIDRVEQAAQEHPLAAVNELGELFAAAAHAAFGSLGTGAGEAWEQRVAEAVGSQGDGTSLGPEAAEAGAAVAGEIGEAVLEAIGAGGEAGGDFVGSVVSAGGDLFEKSAAGLEALGNGDVGEAAALFGEGVVDVLDEASDAGLAVVKGGVGMAGELLEGAGEVAREIGEGAAEMAQGAAKDVADWTSGLADKVFRTTW